MNLHQFLGILSAHRRIILLTLVVSGLTALAVSLFMPKTYKASTSLVVNYSAADPVTGTSYPAQMMPGFMATQVDIISNMATAIDVVEKLGLADSPAVRERYEKETKGKQDIKEWQARKLLRKLDVSPSRESSVIQISFSASDPATAAKVANAFADAYQDRSVQLRVDPSKKAAVYFNTQIEALRQKFDAAQRKVAEYQKQFGIVSVDQHVDVETSRLNELSTQLAVAQAQTVEAVSRQKHSAGASSTTSPDVEANPTVRAIRGQLATSEAALAGMARTLTEEHPRYVATRTEVERLRAELRRAMQQSASAVSSNADILQQREAQLIAAVNAQKARVMDATTRRAELKMLTNEMENAQRAYETASQRYLQANLQGQANLVDISVLTKALVPVDPVAPNMLLNAAFALVLGLIISIGLVLIIEFSDRRIRSLQDLSDLLDAPVFGLRHGQSRIGQRTSFLPRLFPTPRMLK